jgi:hypothetical protein
MNWGTKLAIVMGLFMSFIITLAVLMIRSESDDLVDVNYYERGIEYDKDYVRKNQLIADMAKPEMSVTDQQLTIKFKRPAKGIIRFIHPSDKTKDNTISINTGSDNQIQIPINEYRKGHWKVSLEWESNQKSYLYEKNIIID